MATDRLGRLPTIVLALVVPLVALVTVLVTLNVTDDSTSSAAARGGGGKPGSGTAIVDQELPVLAEPDLGEGRAPRSLVTNDDGTVHTLTADDKSFDTGDLDGGAAKAITIAKAGQVHLPLRHPQLHDRHDRGEMSTVSSSSASSVTTSTGSSTDSSDRRRDALSGGIVTAAVVGATALLVSGWVHFYLYFRGGYRGIAIDSVLGLTISRSFAINAIAAVVIAEAVILGLRYRALLLPAAAARRGVRGGDARGLLPVAHPRHPGVQGDVHDHRSRDRHGLRSGDRAHPGAGRDHGTASAATSSTLNT